MNQYDKITCFLCKNTNKVKSLPEVAVINNKALCGIDCPCCGKYYIDYELISSTPNSNSPISKLSEEDILKLRWLTKTSKMPITITKDNLNQLLASVPYPSNILKKIDLVLEFLATNTKYLFQKLYMDLIDYPLFFCSNSKELLDILDYLNKEEFISTDINNLIRASQQLEDADKAYEMYKNSIPKTLQNYPVNVSLLPKGINYIEESGKNLKSDQCFVAMWFNDEMQKIYSDVINPAIEQGAGYKAMKIDNKEHVNYITDEIIKEIRRSKFMIADLTGSRSGVYYEAGFAFGLGLPVIFTCRKDWENNIEKECGCTRDGVHFDIKQRNMIFWEKGNPEEFKKALINRIGAVVGLNT